MKIMFSFLSNNVRSWGIAGDCRLSKSCKQTNSSFESVFLNKYTAQIFHDLHHSQSNCSYRTKSHNSPSRTNNLFIRQHYNHQKLTKQSVFVTRPSIPG